MSIVRLQNTDELEGLKRQLHENLSENAMTILKERYLEPNETPFERYKAVAEEVACAEETMTEQLGLAKEILNAYSNQEILPNTPALMNYGKPFRVRQGSACFVLPIGDDLADIFETVKKAALIHKTGGGTGYNFSLLRPEGALVKTTGKPSSGVIPFLKAFDAATGAVSQGGARRGANMGILNITHPDIIKFIKCKAEDKQISNFNLSVGITERFLEAAENNEEWELFFEDENGIRMPFHPYGDTSLEAVTELKIPALYLYNLICEYAHKNGEPGIIFVDRIQAANSVPMIVIMATNPCGEQPLPPDNSCVLASINLAKIVKRGAVNWNKFDALIRLGVRMLDNIVTLNEYPIPEIKQNHDLQRRIGLGISGLGDLLILMGSAYGSADGRATAGGIMKFLNDRSHYHSYMLGKEKGNFPLFAGSKFDLNGPYREEALEFYKGFLPAEELQWLLDNNLAGFMRNAATTTIAPTGSLTSFLGCECYGGEPLFAIGYIRTILDGHKLPYVSDLFERMAKENGFYTPNLIFEVAKKGSADVDGVPAKWKNIFRNANEITVEEHILMQAELQKHCDSGISKTINMPSSATVGDVKKAYRLAKDTGVIKGLTVYRDKSRDTAPITVGMEELEKAEEEAAIAELKEDPDVFNPDKLTHCPKCNVELVFSEGCKHCPTCGMGFCSI